MAPVHYLSAAHEKPDVSGLRGFSREGGEVMAPVHYLSPAHEKPYVLGLRGFSREIGAYVKGLPSSFIPH
jgi:hypothetical protein